MALYVAHQRGALRRADPLRRRQRRRDRHRRRASPAGYLDRAYRLVALFIDRDYGLLRWAPVFLLAFVGRLVALALAPRAALARAARRARRSSSPRGLCAAGARRPAARGRLPRPHDVRLLVPAAAPAGGAAAGGAAGGAGPAPRAADGPRARRADARARRWLYADVRCCGGALVADRPDAPFGPAHRRCSRCSTAATTGRSRSPARSAAWRSRPRRCSSARHSRQTRRRHARQVLRVAHERAAAGRGGGRRSAPRPARCPRPRATG